MSTSKIFGIIGKGNTKIADERKPELKMILHTLLVRKNDKKDISTATI